MLLKMSVEKLAGATHALRTTKLDMKKPANEQLCARTHTHMHVIWILLSSPGVGIKLNQFCKQCVVLFILHY